MPTTSIRVGGAYREVRNKWIRISGQYRQVANTWVRVGGAWELVYRRAFVFSVQTTTGTTNTTLNLRTQAIAAGWDQTAPLEATVTVRGIQGQSSTAAFIADGSYPAGSSLNLTIQSGDSIRGRGGNGGRGGTGDASSGRTDGATGGTAIFIRNLPTTITNNGTIAAGGTGGDGGFGNTRSGGPGSDPLNDGGGGGGGGAGSPAGSGGLGGVSPDLLGVDGTNGTAGGLTSAGSGGSGAPDAGSGSNGFTPGQGPTTNRTGIAIDGVSNVSFAVTGTIQGRQIN